MTGQVSGRLEEELRRARAELEDLRAEFAELADPDVVSRDDEHDSEGSTIGFERARVAGLMGRAERRITDLEQAAARDRAGVYDCCESCGGPIGGERLEALPATRSCVACAGTGAPSPPPPGGEGAGNRPEFT